MHPRKNQVFSHQQNIWILTNYGEFKSSTALRREFRMHFKLSARQLPHSYALSSYQHIYGLRWRLSFQAFRSFPNQNYRIKHWYSKKPGQRKAQLFHFQSSKPPSRVSETVERYAASFNKYQINTAVNDILPKTQTCIESDGGAFEYKLK